MRKGKIIHYIINAAIFIGLEIAALTMLKHNGELQSTWLGQAGQGFMGWIWGGTQKISDYFSLREQNEALAEENFRLQLQLARFADQAQEDSLSAMLPVDNIAGDYLFIHAPVRKISNNSQHNYIILGKGMEDGVRKGDGVITSQGAVGIIDAVSENFSYARSFKNHDMSVSARLGRDGAVGPLSWDGKSRNKALLREIPHHIMLTPGDTVYTSGMSSLFPADIPLGTTGASKIVNGSTYEIAVELFEDYSSLRYVVIAGNLGFEEIRTLEKEVQ